jgi:hypothetical protein
MMYSFGAAAKGAREEQPTEENKTPAAPRQKPVFTGKAKLRMAPTDTEETPAANMNYDFSKMNMSAATSGKRPEGEEGERRGGGGYRDRPLFEDDFEVVADKPKREPRKPLREFAKPTFGGDKPTFSRGGANRQE